MRTQYVELHRRFLQFRETMDTDEAAWISYYRPQYTELRFFDWDNLTAPESRCIVILGEAGSGKSWEFEARAETLNSRGETAFLLPVDDLVDREIKQCLDGNGAARLNDWLARSDRAVFFLDAVDDARLRDPNALRKALRALDRGLGQAFPRACIVLSCRVSDWQPTADLELLSGYFGTPEKEDEADFLLREPKKSVPLRVVQLAPLDRGQVGILAKARGVEPVDEFLFEVDQADAWVFAGRPRDVDDLIGSWKERRKLGSLTELIEQNIARKLRETRIADDPLESVKARLGGERLGAAGVLCRKNTFLLPDEFMSSDVSGSSVDPAAVLPDFQAAEQRALLARPIFDEATYGRIRFHHRTVKEYLAASWFRRILEQGCRPEIEDLLFQKKHGRKFIAPSLVSIAAWLASFDPEVRQRLIEAEPLALVQHGDPENIDPLDRASMLGQMMTAYSEHTPVWLDASALRRFTHQCFAPKIKALLRRRGLSPHSKYFLLLLIWHGHVVSCADNAFRIATDPSEDLEIRSLAVRAVGATADEKMLKALGEDALKCSDLPRALAGGLFDALYPGTFGVRELIELVKLVHGGDGRPSDAPTFSLTQIFKDNKRTPAGDLTRLLTELFALVTQPPLISQSGIEFASRRYAWLLEPVKTVLTRTALEVRDIPKNAELCRSFRLTLSLLASCHDYGVGVVYDLKDLNRAVNLSPELRQGMFWDRVADETDGSKESSSVPRVPRLSPADLAWLIKDAEDLDRPFEQRRRAFETAVLHWSWRQDEEKAQLDKLRAAAAHESSFREYLERAENYRKQTREDQNREAANRETGKERQRIESVENLRSQLDDIRSGKHVNALFWLISFASEKSPKHNFSGVSWGTIAAELADDVADATRDGAIAFWRTWRPPLPHEGTPNQTPGQVAIGLAGIAWELDRGLDVTALSDAEAECALRYALFEYNGFPKWAAQLANTHPHIVPQVMAEALIAEFDGHSGMMLQNLSHANSGLLVLLAPTLEGLLKDREPREIQSLRYVLSILAAAERTSTIAEIARARIPTLSNDRPRHTEWLSAWFQADPDGSLDFIERLSPKESRSAIAELASQLGAHRLLPKQSSPSRAFLEPSVLRRLIPLVFGQVPVAQTQDFDAVSGAVAVGRPDARFFRESILQQLANMPGDEPYRILTELANTPELERERTRLLQAAEWQASNDCERTFKPEEIYRWEKKCLEEPKTSDDLFRIALGRLEALKRDVEQGDFSERGLFHAKIEETLLQKYVANRLKIAARGQYTVHREEEVDLENRTDIRLWYRKELVATIEVKCANKWTYLQLRDSLKNQLVGKYLRDHNSRHGVLLLGHMGDKDSWKGPDGKKLSFDELTLTLNGEAEQIASADPGVSSLAVGGIDFRSPSCLNDLPRERVGKRPPMKKRTRRSRRS